MVNDCENVKPAMEALEEAYHAVFAVARADMPAREITAVLSESLRRRDVPGSANPAGLVRSTGRLFQCRQTR